MINLWFWTAMWICSIIAIVGMGGLLITVIFLLIKEKIDAKRNKNIKRR